MIVCLSFDLRDMYLLYVVSVRSYLLKLVQIRGSHVFLQLLYHFKLVSCSMHTEIYKANCRQDIGGDFDSLKKTFQKKN